MSLAIAKYVEIKTKKSIKSVVKQLKKATEARIYDQTNKREVTIKAQINDETKEILNILWY